MNFPKNLIEVLKGEKIRFFLLNLLCVSMLFRYQFFFNDYHQYAVYVKFVYYLTFGFSLVLGMAIFLTSKLKEVFSTRISRISFLLLLTYVPALIFAEGNYKALLSSYLYYFVLFLLIPIVFSNIKFETVKSWIFQVNNFVIYFSIFSLLASFLIFYIDPKIPFNEISKIGFFYSRLWGYTGHPNKDAMLAGISVFLSLFTLLFFDISNKRQLVLKINIFLQIYLISFSGSRAGFVLLILIVFPSFFLINFRPYYRRLLYSKLSRKFVLGILTFILITPFIPNIYNSVVGGIVYGGKEKEGVEFQNRFEPKFIQKTSHRMELWEKCLKIHEVYNFGVGFQNIGTTCRQLHPEEYLLGLEAGMHNVFLQSLLGGGLIVIGVAFYLYFNFIFVFIRTTLLSLFKESKMGLELIVVSCFLLALLIHAQVENSLFFDVNLISFLFWFYFAILRAFINENQNGTIKDS